MITLTDEAAQQVLALLQEAQSYTNCATFSPSLTEELRAAEKKMQAAIDAPPPSGERAALIAAAQEGHGLSLDLLERLSKTLTKLGYSTPEGGMEHFGARIEGQLYNLCRGVDGVMAQQVAVPQEQKGTL